MSNFIMNTIAGKIKRRPVTGLVLRHAPGSILNSSFTCFYHLESESSWRLEPLLRRRDDGSDVTLGYRLSASLYVPHNRYINDGLIDRLETTVRELSDGIRPQIMLMLGKRPYWSEGIPDGIINADNGGLTVEFGSLINTSSLSYTIESVEYRPRLIISVSSFIKDILSSWSGSVFLSES